MSIKLFSLHNVPDDEAEEIRELLRSNELDFYETPAGNWGVSLPYLWLHDENQLEKAKVLIDHYQQERLIRVREEYAQLEQTGRHRTLGDVIRENPQRFVVYLVVIATVLYLSIMPFLDIGK
ncbi:MAG: hypothetical protein KJ958_02135 [Gammaproteobacteria bacterium]|nr:hypothetical protein [Gammaproteobacteria bacterium]MBU1977949.1 hypothetical protein [Gammaproteobacteria bacterium]